MCFSKTMRGNFTFTNGNMAGKYKDSAVMFCDIHILETIRYLRSKEDQKLQDEMRLFRHLICEEIGMTETYNDLIGIIGKRRLSDIFYNQQIECSEKQGCRIVDMVNKLWLIFKQRDMDTILNDITYKQLLKTEMIEVVVMTIEAKKAAHAYMIEFQHTEVNAWFVEEKAKIWKRKLRETCV